VPAWDAKRTVDSVWPVSAVRWLFAGHQVCAWGGEAGEDAGLQVWSKADSYLNGEAIPKTLATRAGR
jgi:hypothetical protein